MIVLNPSRKHKLGTLLLSLFLVLLFVTFGLSFFSKYQIEDWQVVNENSQVKPGFIKPFYNQMQQFDESKIYSIPSYTRQLVEVAGSKGIPKGELKKALEITDKEMPQTLKTPIMIQTMRYKGKDSFLVVYQIGLAKNRIISHFKAKFSREHHHFLFVFIERRSNKILSSLY